MSGVAETFLLKIKSVMTSVRCSCLNRYLTYSEMIFVKMMICKQHAKTYSNNTSTNNYNICLLYTSHQYTAHSHSQYLRFRP